MASDSFSAPLATRKPVTGKPVTGKPVTGKPVTLCPSGQPDGEGAIAFGVIVGTVESPRLLHFATPLPVTTELLASAEPVTPTEVFRFASTCEEKACVHFEGTRCRLAERIVEGFDAVAEALPPCQIRASCRWWQQEGQNACMRCPQVVTQNFYVSEQVHNAADPSVYSA